MKWHGALGRVKDEQLAPGKPKQSHLVCDLQVWEEWNIPCPLDSAEQHARRQFANVLDAHDVVGLHTLTAIARRGVGFCSQQQ